MKANMTIRRAMPLLAALFFSGWTLLAQTEPSITSQPTNVLGSVGGVAAFNVGASGTEPFSYQWYFNGAPASINGLITTVAGNGISGSSGDGGAATNAKLQNPGGVVVDALGDLFISDTASCRIRRVGTNGIINTMAGNGNPGYSGDGGAATNALLFYPLGVAVDATGNLFIADNLNSRIREVGINGIITTVAGEGSFGNFGYSGDGGAATNAELNEPSGVVLDLTGNLFIADTGNCRIRKVATNGIITTVAGNGSPGYLGDGETATNAELNSPSGVIVDASGNLFIADTYNNVIREVGTNGIIATVAGNGTQSYSGDGGPATNASLNYPTGVAVDAAGNLFVADFNNNRIREIGTNGIITTVAGNGAGSYSGDGGAATNASLNQPLDVATDAVDDLYIADKLNNRIRKVTASNLSLDAEGASLVLSNLSAANVGNYYVVVTNAYGSVVSSEASLSLVGIWPQLVNVTPTNGGVVLSFGGPASNTYTVSYTTNLLPPVAWTPLATNTADASGNVIVIDTNTVNSSSKFYRVSSP
jgi:sugar lactone lactonase YvrE